jgi:hypothetical protein
MGGRCNWPRTVPRSELVLTVFNVRSMIPEWVSQSVRFRSVDCLLGSRPCSIQSVSKNRFSQYVLTLIQKPPSFNWLPSKTYLTAPLNEFNSPFELQVHPIQVKVFWVVTPCSVVGYQPMFQRSMLPPSSGWSEDGGSMDLWNVGVLLQQYTASRPRRPRLESSSPWKPPISMFNLLHLFGVLQSLDSDIF